MVESSSRVEIRRDHRREPRELQEPVAVALAPVPRRRGCMIGRTRAIRSPMERRNPTVNRDTLLAAKGLLEFKPWMLALAVFLACALGVAVMEQFRDTRSMWAQVTP